MTLAILEVSRKQDYIFSSRRLGDNARRSLEIAYVTGAEGDGRFFREAAGDLFQPENLISTGGGHTTLSFPDAERARTFVVRVTEAARRRFPDMELYAKIMDCDGGDLGAGLETLSKALEAKKARRRASFGWRGVGVEKLDAERYKPVPIGAAERDRDIESALKEFEKRLGAGDRKYPREFEKILKSVPDGGENFLAVVHIDGNSMGKRVRKLYDSFQGRDFASARMDLQAFSDGIQKDFEEAFRRTAQALARHCQEVERALEERRGDAAQAPKERRPDPEFLPIRPIILAGDDVTFVSAGRYGLQCAEIFLNELASLRNPNDHASYAACAGVAMVHKNYPFHRAYELAEELCGEAKRFGAEIDPECRVSVMDWHIEFGQLKDSLSELRNDYQTEDGNRLELRPVAVTAADMEGGEARESFNGKWESVTGGVRTWEFFRGMCGAIGRDYGKIARGKIKNFREALKQGEKESEFYLEDKEISDFLYHGLTAQYGSDAYRKAYEQITGVEGKLIKETFRQIGGEKQKRCLFFDAIEIMDHCELFEGAKA